MNNFFQSIDCYHFYDSLPFVEAFKFEVKRNGEIKGRIVGYIQKDGGKIKRFFSRRAIINGGPMLADDIREEEISTLLNNCKKQLKRKSIYIETRNFNDYSKYKDSFQKCGWKYEPHFNFHIDTTSDIDSQMDNNRKRNIRTSLKKGAVIEEAKCIEDVKSLYSLLVDLYTSKVKTPIFPLSFFESLYKMPYGKLLLVKYENRVVGGIVCVCGSKTVYEWFVCGKDGIFKNIYPSSVATYAGIRYAYDNGYKRFDFMGAGAPNDGGYGVRDFKARFGGQLVEHGRFKCILNFPLYYLGVLGVKILKKI